MIMKRKNYGFYAAITVLLLSLADTWSVCFQ